MRDRFLQPPLLLCCWTCLVGSFWKMRDRGCVDTWTEKRHKISAWERPDTILLPALKGFDGAGSRYESRFRCFCIYFSLLSPIWSFITPDLHSMSLSTSHCEILPIVSVCITAGNLNISISILARLLRCVTPPSPFFPFLLYCNTLLSLSEVNCTHSSQCISDALHLKPCL